MLDPALAVFVATPLRRIVAVNRAAVQPYTSKGRELFRRAPPPLQAREDSMETKIYGDTAFKRNQGLKFAGTPLDVEGPPKSMGIWTLMNDLFAAIACRVVA